MSYMLLTGATGLLGRYLLRDLTLADVPLAVVVRPTRWESAAQRIETVMARWEDGVGPGAGPAGRAGRGHRRSQLRAVGRRFDVGLRPIAGRCCIRPPRSRFRPTRPKASPGAATSRGRGTCSSCAGKPAFASAITSRPPTSAAGGAGAFWKASWTSASSRATTTSRPS